VVEVPWYRRWQRVREFPNENKLYHNADLSPIFNPLDVLRAFLQDARNSGFPLRGLKTSVSEKENGQNANKVVSLFTPLTPTFPHFRS
jgi:hypothetical protein